MHDLDYGGGQLWQGEMINSRTDFLIIVTFAVPGGQNSQTSEK